MNDPIPFLPDPEELAGPALPGKVFVGADKYVTYEKLGADLLACAYDCVAKFGDFHFAVSGGSTPFPFYLSLMTDPHYRGFPWASTHLWIVDERRVSFDNELSNWGKIGEIFVGHSGIADSNVHPMMATDVDAAPKYEAQLRECLGRRAVSEQRLDFVLLGMGDNGHTASLFPETKVLDEQTRWVGECDGPTVTPPARVTMTYPLLNASRCVAVLVLGAGKTEMIARIAKRTDDFHVLPILGIKPSPGSLAWYLDRAACG